MPGLRGRTTHTIDVHCGFCSALLVPLTGRASAVNIPPRLDLVARRNPGGIPAAADGQSNGAEDHVGHVGVVAATVVGVDGGAHGEQRVPEYGWVG